ncbi:MAG: DUF503 domain-containing protein [Candidatus Zixiibacteriota bacterium]|nr:MAG: DUF503 domain-containing protein [candidate division Zixibacteria bacterium]
MVTVILTVRLDIPGAGSLKEKRRVVKSLLARLRNDFNISIAEVADNDVLKSATLGAAIVSNDSSFGHQVISKVVNRIEASRDVLILDYSTETY